MGKILHERHVAGCKTCQTIRCCPMGEKTKLMEDPAVEVEQVDPAIEGDEAADFDETNVGDVLTTNEVTQEQADAEATDAAQPSGEANALLGGSSGEGGTLAARPEMVPAQGGEALKVVVNEGQETEEQV